MNNTMTVGQLKELLDKMAVEDHVVVAVDCCQSSSAAHIMEAGTFESSYADETFSLDPTIHTTKAGTTLVFRANDDFISIDRYGDEEDTEGE